MSAPFPGPLAADARTALSTLVRRACESSLRSPGTASRTDALRQAAQTLNSAAQESLVRLSRSLNDRAPINQLPREIFLQILLHLSLRGRICSSHVCRHWRSVALDFPDLWSEFSGRSTRRGELDNAAAVLARSGSAPLSLDLFVSSSCDALGALLREHMHHTRTLSLYVSFEFVRGDKALLILPLLHALEEPAPILQHFNLRLNRPKADLYVPYNLFAHAASMLDTVRLIGIAMRPSSVLSSIRILSLNQREVDFLHIIGVYPRLEQLHVSTLRLSYGDAQRATAHNLRLLDISGKVEAAAIVTQLTCTQPLKVWIDLTDDEVLHYVLANFPKRSLRRVRLYINFPILARHLELAYDSGPGITWALSPTVDTPIMQLVLQDAALMSGVTHLALHELQWPLHLAELSLPCLRKLDIVLDSFADPSSGYMAEYSLRQHAGILYDDAPSILHCPLLEEVQISYPTGLMTKLGIHSGPTLAVDAHDIRAFITTRLQYDSHLGRLGRLILRNVHLEDPLRGAGMQALTGAVVSIEYRVVRTPKVPELHQAGHMMTWAYNMYD